MTALIELLKPTRALLLDFDGPVCSVFGGYPAPAVADELRAVVADRLGHVPPPLVDITGPHHLLQIVADLDHPDLTRAVADALRDAELVAVRTAVPTPGITRVLAAAEDVGPPVAIVSNNHADAVRQYLHEHKLIRYIDILACRVDGMHLRELKPDPLLVRAALTPMRVDPADAVLIGDTVTDIEAALAAGVIAMGYANKPGKQERLAAAGAQAIIRNMADIATALYDAADAG